MNVWCIRGGFKLCLGILCVLIGSIHLAGARPKIRQAFFEVFPSAVGSRLDNLPSHSMHCGVCHYDFNGGGTRNPWGATIEAVLASYPNTDAGRSNAVYSVRMLDPENDGHSTYVEVTSTNSFINTPTFPGLNISNYTQVLNVSLTDIQNYLTPRTAQDTTPPVVQVLSPNGGEMLTANRITNITWTATDSGGVGSVSIYLSLDNGASFQPLALGIANSGTFAWVPANRPTGAARIRVVAMDTALNSGSDQSDNVFTIVSPGGGRVPTTLRDFDMPGSQPFEAGVPYDMPTTCAACHGNYNTNVEPYFNWQGSMMAHASRDPLFLANLAIANQDAPESGDLCLRCHMNRGWLQGRSVPTNGSRLVADDMIGVSCSQCHRMVDPVYDVGLNPTNDASILAALTFPGTNFGNGMAVIDPTETRRGPFTNTVNPHAFAASSFHREAAFCGTCHDVSNPAFQKDGQGSYIANTFDAPATNFSAHSMLPVERTYSEWANSSYNTLQGVYAPQFAGNKSGGMVSTCQDCHMRDVAGQGCDPAQFPTVTTRTDLPLHDMTGGSTWVPALLTNLFPAEVNAAAIAAGINRANYLLSGAATLSVGDAGSQLKVTVTNNCGHKLPTGYPEGRRIWINVKFFDESTNLVSESGAYDDATGVLTHDAQAKVYEVHPGIETNLANALGLSPGPSFHFVLNNKVYSDNRIPPRGFNNANFSSFGGAPVNYAYADGQYWDDTLYAIPANATRAEVRLYYQSTSKEFVEFLRDENVTNSKGQEMYNLWTANNKCPPTLMGVATWLTPFKMKAAYFNNAGHFQLQFVSRPGTTYTVEYADELNATPVWHQFQNNGSKVAAGLATAFEDDFTSNTSGTVPTTGMRYYRVSWTP